MADGAVTTVGSPLTVAAEPSSCDPTSTWTNTALATATVAVPFDGAILRWRIRLMTGGGTSTYKVRVIRPAAGSTYTGAGTGPAQTAPSAGVNVMTLPTPLPVRAGDLIGLDCDSPAGPAPFAASVAGSTFVNFNPLLADGGAARSPSGSLNDEALVNADVEPLPSISSVLPASGSTGGGTAVVISGSHLADVTGVTFGGTAASGVSVVSDTQVNATAPAHAAGTVDVQAINPAGTSPAVAGDSFTYQAPASTGTGGPTAAPVLAALRLSPRTFRAASSGASIATAKPPIGTRIAYVNTQPSTTTFTVQHHAQGIKKGKKCVARPKHPKRGSKRCVRYRNVGRFTHTDTAGAIHFKFTGRVNSKRLSPGSYSLSVVATNAKGSSSSLRKSFRIVR